MDFFQMKISFQAKAIAVKLKVEIPFNVKATAFESKVLVGWISFK
jgi:hypothetical protein